MSEYILEARRLAKAFPSPRGEIEVLREASFELEAGESLSITGESGCGKTTLLNVLAGLETADAGSVCWEGEALDAQRLSEWAPMRGGFMGLVFQSYYLVPELSALENVLLGQRLLGPVHREDRAHAARLLDKVGLSERAEAVPAKLSGGERQRVAIARALVNNPRLILADEPTGNLDEYTGASVMEWLLGLCASEDVALVLVTHNREFARRTQRHLRLTEGCLQGD